MPESQPPRSLSQKVIAVYMDKYNKTLFPQKLHANFDIRLTKSRIIFINGVE